MNININKVMEEMRRYNKETYNHSVRVSEIAKNFAIYLKLPFIEINILTLGGLLHDIGKMKVPIEILSKNGPLTDEEFNSIKKHPTVGVVLANRIDLGGYEPYRNIINNIIYTHHILLNKKYPQDQEIEKSRYADVISIIDCYEALTAKRCYKEALTEEKALQIMEDSGDYNKELFEEFIKFLNLKEEAI